MEPDSMPDLPLILADLESLGSTISREDAKAFLARYYKDHLLSRANGIVSDNRIGFMFSPSSVLKFKDLECENSVFFYRKKLMVIWEH